MRGKRKQKTEQGVETVSETKGYNIGQILYMSLTSGDFIPVQVVEEITKKTLEGVVTEYIVSFGAGEKTTRALSTLLKQDYEVFDSIEDLRKNLMTKAEMGVNNIIEMLKTRENTWYGIKHEQQ